MELESLAMGLKSFSEMSEEDIAAWEAATDEHVLRYWQSILDGTSNVMSVCTKVEKQLRIGDDGLNSDENGPSMVNANPFDGFARAPDEDSMSHHQELMASTKEDEPLVLPLKRSPRDRGTEWDDLIEDTDSYGKNKQKKNGGIFRHDASDPVLSKTTQASEEQSHLGEPLLLPQKRSPRSRGVDYQGEYGYDFGPIIGNRHLASDTFLPSMSAVPSTSGEPSVEPTWTPQPVVYGVVTESGQEAAGSDESTVSVTSTGTTDTSQQEGEGLESTSVAGTTDPVFESTTTSETMEESYVYVYSQVFIVLTNATADGDEASNATNSSSASATSLDLGSISLTSTKELASQPFAQETNRDDYNKVLEAQGTELSDSSVVIVLTEHPSMTPSVFPSDRPSSEPSSYPSRAPSGIPSRMPSSAPSDSPSVSASLAPSDGPSDFPSRQVSDGPSVEASPIPSALPSNDPTLMASVGPSSLPSTSPTLKPSAVPSVGPSSGPIIEPTKSPSEEPSSLPSEIPTPSPTMAPTDEPTPRPTRVSCFVCVDTTIVCSHNSKELR